MKRTEVFPSKWLSAADLPDGDSIVTIESVEMQSLKNQQTQKDEEKPVITFTEDVKPFVVNITNWKAIERATGEDDTDNWVGRKIILYAAEVEAFGEQKLAIRVRPHAPKSKPLPGATKPGVRKPAPQVEHEEPAAKGDDNIPF